MYSDQRWSLNKETEIAQGMKLQKMLSWWQVDKIFLVFLRVEGDLSSMEKVCMKCQTQASVTNKKKK